MQSALLHSLQRKIVKSQIFISIVWQTFLPTQMSKKLTNIFHDNFIVTCKSLKMIIFDANGSAKLRSSYSLDSLCATLLSKATNRKVARQCLTAFDLFCHSFCYWKMYTRNVYGAPINIHFQMEPIRVLRVFDLLSPICNESGFSLFRQYFWVESIRIRW